VDRICPYLALADDGRTVADGYDAEHRCHALTPPAPLERARQVQLCLTEAHTRCERFAAARTAWLAASSGLPRVAPDVAFGRTRLVLEPEPAWRTLSGPPVTRVSRRTMLIGAAGAAVVVLLLLGNAFGIVGRTPASRPSPTPSASASPSIATTPTLAPTPAPTATAVPTVSPTGAPTATPGPTPHTYIVQKNDNLGLIAARFRTTAAAIAAASGIAVDSVLNIGQVLIIP
jgi:LysM repeat protein